VFLTTEPIAGGPHTVLRVIFSVACVRIPGQTDSPGNYEKAHQAAIVKSLAALEQEGLQLRADAVNRHTDERGTKYFQLLCFSDRYCY